MEQSHGGAHDSRVVRGPLFDLAESSAPEAAAAEVTRSRRDVGACARLEASQARGRDCQEEEPDGFIIENDARG
jgi:hypothetical protein